MSKIHKPVAHEFVKGFSSWSNSVASRNEIDWTEQLSILSGITDSITNELALEDIIKSIYSNVNILMDAFQFVVGIYDQENELIRYIGMIEDGKRIPDFVVDANAHNRFASWCIKNEREIFINDMDKEFINYLETKPVPITGCNPKAAIYVPLRLGHKVMGLITVRTIHENAYKQHHLHILKTVGQFIIRTIVLENINSENLSKAEHKEWKWNKEDQLTLKAARALEALTDREKELLLLLASGLQNKAIAEKLFISSGTVKTHTLNIYQKMEVENRTRAIVKAIEWGWIV